MKANRIMTNKYVLKVNRSRSKQHNTKCCLKGNVETLNRHLFN